MKALSSSVAFTLTTLDVIGNGKQFEIKTKVFWTSHFVSFLQYKALCDDLATYEIRGGVMQLSITLINLVDKKLI